MSDDRVRVNIFLDNELGLGNDCTFEDYDSKEAILDYAIELVGENDNLTVGCGVGPLMRHIEAWVEQFEAESKNQNTLKYEFKFIKEMKENGFCSQENENEIKVVAQYLYSKESKTIMLKQVMKQIELNGIVGIENVEFQLKKNNELGNPIVNQIKKFDKEMLKFVNEYINKEFKLLLEDNILNLLSAFNIKDLSDISNAQEKKLKI